MGGGSVYSLVSTYINKLIATILPNMSYFHISKLILIQSIELLTHQNSIALSLKLWNISSMNEKKTFYFTAEYLVTLESIWNSMIVFSSCVLKYWIGIFDIMKRWICYGRNNCYIEISQKKQLFMYSLSGFILENKGIHVLQWKKDNGTYWHNTNDTITSFYH